MSISIFLGFTIIEEVFFQRKIDSLLGNYPRLHNDVHGTITWALGKNPEIGEVIINESNHRILKTTAAGETPSFRVIFRVDKPEGKVYLVSIMPEVEEEI